MPRILDMIDHSVLGRTPEQLDLDIDYLARKPGPRCLIADDGTYNAGWFESFDGELNFDQSSAFNLALHRWFHLSVDTPERFIVCNIADFYKGGNTAVLVADKRTGAFNAPSRTYMGPQNDITATPDGLRFIDPASHSFLATTADNGVFTFSVHADDVHLSGQGRLAVGPPFVHVTRFHRGRGSLQFYGAFELEHGTLVMGDEVIPLPAGALGTFDRTLGHQRGLQAWNWIAATGYATHAASGRRALICVQVARDREMARPVVLSRKYVVWVDDQVRKVPEAAFHYDVTDEDTRETGPWHIHSAERGESWLDLHFTPRFHRRESRSAVVLVADFNQYYGEVSGQVCLDGELWELEPTFAVAEESLLQV
ncbi:MAG: DUF2804 family protein [Alphaproteobacteria bacterium]|nr:DUF2804 family protein [Alphaproteobacteria bacterium]